MDKYEKIRLVGRGAYGTVHLCHEISSKKPVILKEIPVDQMSVEERQATMNEAKVLSMLDHPHVVAYYESFLEEKTLTIVMEYVQGGTLFDYLKQRNENLLEEKEVLHYFGQMVYTLQHVHSKLVLHRDLKSQNILLNKNKTIIKVGDFGISKVLSSKSKAFTVVGTPCYISPELCEGKPYNQKSDIWALGCLLYELMTLKRPFDADTLSALVMKIMKGSFEPVSDIYSQDLKKLLTSMLHLDPQQRPTAAQIMCQPFMINVIFQLYFTIGSIPCIKKPQKDLKLSTKIHSEHKHQTSATDEEKSDHTFKSKSERRVWFFESKSSCVLPLPSALKDSVQCIAMGSNRKMGVTESGILVGWVSNPTITIEDVSGQHMRSESSFVSLLIDEKFSEIMTSVTCGEDFTACLSANGVVFTFGKASSGCLGQLSNNDAHQPKIVKSLFNCNIISISSGSRHVLAVSDESKVFAWGHGTHGCLGLGAIEFQSLPQCVKIPSEHKPMRVHCGKDCSFIITKEKTVLACGNNRHNKLAMDSGEGHQRDEIKYFTSVQSHPLPMQRLVAVSSGKSHSVFLCESGDVYSVGCNHHHQLGWGDPSLGYSLPNVIRELKDHEVSEIECGDDFTLAVTKDKRLYGWGHCPESLTGSKDEVPIATLPSRLSNKRVVAVACESENCLMVEELSS